MLHEAVLESLALDPAAWESYRLRTPTPELLNALRGRREPILRARYIEVLAYARDAGLLNEALRALEDPTVPMREGTRVQVRCLLGLWGEALAEALAYELPEKTTPLDLENAATVLMYGGMAARTSGQDELAARMHGGAVALTRQTGMRHRARMLQVEGLRVDNIQGRGDPERVRALLRVEAGDVLPERAGGHILHVYAESLTARGLYASARGLLDDLRDDRSAGMRAFYSAVLDGSFGDPGGGDDWLRLARCVGELWGGVWRVDDLGMTYRPQVTYARLLTAAAEIVSGRDDAALRLLGESVPGFADQRVVWGFLRVRAGVAVGVPEYVQEGLRAWASGIGDLYDARGVLRVLAGIAPEWFVALSLLPGATAEVVQVRGELPLLTGQDIQYGGGTVTGRGRAGTVLIGQAVGAVVKRLESSERTRWEARVVELRRAGVLPRDPVNVGVVIDLLGELGGTGADVRHALRDGVAMLADDARALVLGALKKVNSEEDLAFIGGGRGVGGVGAG